MANYRARGVKLYRACTKTRNNETKPPKRNHRSDRNETAETTETAETSEMKQNHRNKQNPLPLLRANRKQANLSDIQANQSAIQANRSVPCTQVSLNSTPVSLNIAQVSLKNAHWLACLRLALNKSNGLPCFGDFVSCRSFWPFRLFRRVLFRSFRSFRFGGFGF